ncbi:MAG: glycosyltransferase family 4 protein [Candidatus Omnitrophica bacterium]|nr:glycosyltransferase family 4 protein [Candidatus Omnitrophota bacterium]
MKKQVCKTKGKNKSLNIAHVHWGYPPIIGGVETHLITVMPEMVKQGHSVSILTGAFEGCEDRYKENGVEIFRTPIMDLNWLNERGINGLEKEIKSIFSGFIDKVRPDIINAHNMHYFSKPHAKTLEELARIKGIPLIISAHNSWDDNLFLDLTRNIKWDKYIAVSHFIKRELMGAGVDDRKIAVIHHGIDHEKYITNKNPKNVYKSYPQLKGKKIIFHPARMGLAKGCDISIKAMRLVKERFPDAMLVLAGTKNIIDWGSHQQKDIAYMVNLVDFFGLRNNVLIDSYPLDLMPSLYSVADVCLYPSTVSEPFGLTMLEAMASAKPMIVTESGGMPEVIKDGINGFVIPIRDFEKLASKIIQLLDDKRLNHRFGYTGREMVEQHYTKEIVSSNMIRVYRSVL